MMGRIAAMVGLLMVAGLACAPGAPPSVQVDPTPDIEATVQARVAAIVAAMATPALVPTPTVASSPTPDLQATVTAAVAAELTRQASPTPIVNEPVATEELVTPAPTVEVASTTVSEPTETAGTEAALLARVKESNQAWGNWLALYKYESPRYKETCKLGDYLAFVGSAMLLLRTFLGIPEDAKIEERLDKVVITAESEGRAYGSLLIDGELLEFSDLENKGERWVFLDGQWWAEPEDWREGCPLQKGPVID